MGELHLPPSPDYPEAAAAAGASTTVDVYILLQLIQDENSWSRYDASAATPPAAQAPRLNPAREQKIPVRYRMLVRRKLGVHAHKTRGRSFRNASRRENRNRETSKRACVVAGLAQRNR